jgi:hypothetical protein
MVSIDENWEEIIFNKILEAKLKKITPYKNDAGSTQDVAKLTLSKIKKRAKVLLVLMGLDIIHLILKSFGFRKRKFARPT